VSKPQVTPEWIDRNVSDPQAREEMKAAAETHKQINGEYPGDITYTRETVEYTRRP
jgi:hypothetical protein